MTTKISGESIVSCSMTPWTLCTRVKGPPHADPHLAELALISTTKRAET
jgi:hypothetical protein